MRKQDSGAPKRSLFVALALVVALAAVAASSVGTTRAAAAPTQLTYRGTVNLAASAGSTQISGVSAFETRPATQQAEHDTRSVPTMKAARTQSGRGIVAPSLALTIIVASRADLQQAKICRPHCVNTTSPCVSILVMPKSWFNLVK